MLIRKSRARKVAFDYQRLESRKVLTSLVNTAVVGRHVFYNDSSFDGNNALATAADDNAIALDKVALLPNETATYENISNFSEGINGIIIDADLANASSFSANDIALSTGVAEDLSDLAPLNLTPDVSVRVGEGAGGSDRITIVLPNRSVKNVYLQVKVLANSTTGLAIDDVFYFGNVVGETGNLLADTRVNSGDISGVQANLTNLFSQAEIDSPFDVNRDARVSSADISVIQANLTSLFFTFPYATTPEADPPPVLGNEFLVSSVSEFNSALSQVQPGDSIVLANGTYTNQEFEFDPNNNGTAALPITFRAETPGQVLLNGSSRLFISGDWLVVDGLNFEGGSLSDNSVVEFRAKNNSGEATNSRFTNSQIKDYNPSSESTRYFWVSLYGSNNRVDHNTFSGQNHSGVTVVVWRDSAAPDYHLIDNNHFVDRPESSTNANGFETIRIGTSTESLSDSFTTVEHNLFERTDGEIEIISVKAGSNTIRYNTFLESAGTLTLRHGNNNVVEGNFFIGNAKEGSGGVRVVGEGHNVVNNYFEGLDGRAGGAISIAAGVAGPLNAHAQVKDLLVANNSIVNLNDGAAIFFSEGQGNDNGAGPRTLLATDVDIVNNLISSTGDPLFGGDEGTNFTYAGNIAFGAALGSASGPGISTVDPLLTLGADGLQRLTSVSPAIDAAFTGFSAATGGIDMDRQLRGASFDIGADELSTAPVLRGPLTAADVGNCFHLFTGGSTGNPTGGVITDGLIVQADEFASAIDPNGDGDTFTVVSTSDASDGTAVVAPGGNSVGSTGTQDAVLVYDLQFVEAGSYTAYYRARGFGGSSNSFYTPTDFGVDPRENESLSNDSVYRWETGDIFAVTSADLNSTLEFSISKRERDAELDVIVFHLDGDLTDAELDMLFA